MMDKKNIWEEGLLEKYLLDELSETERLSIEDALNKDKTLKAHFERLESDFERMAFENAIAPPSRIKSAIQHHLEKQYSTIFFSPTLLVAASLAFLFLLTTVLMYLRWQNAQDDLQTIQDQTLVLQERLNALEENYLSTNTLLKTINGPKTIPLVLHGNEMVPHARAVAYVNHDNKMVVVNAQGLPELPKDKTYQMWSDVEGEMINMGLLPTDQELVTLRYIEKAESLNITIEPAGGNDHPTVAQLISYVTL
ncbi:MAG: anti-sigma factor [Bacteroidota bacterium]